MDAELAIIVASGIAQFRFSIEVDKKYIDFYFNLMNMLKSFDISLGQYMWKAAHPLGGVDLLNSRRPRGWRLHYHGDGDRCVFVLCVAVSSGHHHQHTLHVDKYHKITLMRGYRRYFVSHIGLHHTVLSSELGYDWAAFLDVRK